MMEKSTHSERVAVALAMRAACAAACEANAPAKEAEGYRASNDHWRAAAAHVGRVDVAAVLNAADDAPKTAQEEFEIAAHSQNFNCMKNDNGEYIHPITTRAWAIWRMALQAKLQHSDNDKPVTVKVDDGMVTVMLAGKPARMSAKNAVLMGLKPIQGE